LNELKLIDKFDRYLNYLRVSITDRCNLRCMYCAPPRARISWLSHSEILKYEEILRIVRVGAGLGITKIRVTGGEPLVRRGVFDFLKELGQIPEILDLSLTTNAVLLRDNIKRLKDAGIKRLNISLDTLDRERFKKITGHDHFKQVWEGIMAAEQAGFHPIKINTVAMNGVNDDELKEIARLSFSRPFHMRFIEYMPMGDHHLDEGKYLPAFEIMRRISSLGELVPVRHEENDGPAERYRFKDAAGEIGFIRPMSQHFCHQCNRLRLTASGRLRPCLLSDRQEDIKGPLRQGASDEEIVEIFIKTIQFKPSQHHLGTRHSDPVKDVMSRIGG
jgi:cyclic pyranopterin phosphate synthase